jgi:hypothetical protein
MDLEGVDDGVKRHIMDIQEKFLDLFLTPEQGKRWVVMQIEERWDDLLRQYPQHEDHRKSIWLEIDRLKRSLQFGQDPDAIANYHKMPQELIHEWVDVIYSNMESFNPQFLDRVINVLGNPDLVIAFRERSRKTLIQLKALAETMNQLERNTNFLLHQVLNGSRGKNLETLSQYLIDHSPINEMSFLNQSQS